MGGAMDLVSGAKKVIVAMTHTAKGKSKLVGKLSLPRTSTRQVDLIVTELAVIRPTAEGLVLQEIAPGVTVEDVLIATEAELILDQRISVMKVSGSLSGTGVAP